MFLIGQFKFNLLVIPFMGIQEFDKFILIQSINMLHPAAPAYTFQGKKHLIDKLNDGYTDSSPGPLYNTAGLGIKTRCTSFSVGKGSRTKINEGVLNNPSPTHYESKKQSSKKVSFPKSQRIDEQLKNTNPQSTIYNANQNFVKVKYPNYSLGTKYPSIMDDTGNNPGPGDYESNLEVISSAVKSKRSKFGTQKRFSQPQLKHPGVGDYVINQNEDNKGSIMGTIGQADRFPNGPNYPGPGQYKNKSQFDIDSKKPKGKTFGTNLKGCFTLESNTRDSFANYFKEQNPDFRKTFSFGKQRRQIFKSAAIPGPGEYNAEKSKKNTANAFINTGKPVDYDSSRQNPGPGNYEEFKPNSTKYTFGKSKSLKNLGSNPGVGRYQMDKGLSKANYKSWSLGKGKRTNFISKNVAGVGDYEILQKKTGGISIPKASRFPKPNDNPGPGDYQFQSTISNFNFYKKREISTSTKSNLHTK